MNDNLKITYLNQMNAVISDKEKSEILLTALSTINDRDWLENFYMQYATSDNIDIARLSLTCIGHLARMHRNINTDKIIPFLKELQNSNQELNGIIQDVLDDIDVFVNETEIDSFYGMWADRDMDVYQYVRELRKGRMDRFLKEGEHIDFSHLNDYNDNN